MFYSKAFCFNPSFGDKDMRHLDLITKKWMQGDEAKAEKSHFNLKRTHLLEVLWLVRLILFLLTGFL